MFRKHKLTISILLIFLSLPLTLHAAKEKDAKEEPTIELSSEMDDVVVQEAEKVKEEIVKQTKGLLVREPFKWNAGTFEYIVKWAVLLPLEIPEFTRQIAEHSRVLGFSGSVALLLFIMAILYSLFWHQHLLGWVDKKFKPLFRRP